MDIKNSIEGDAMITRDYDFIRAEVKSAAGMVFAPEKAYLVESRLAPVLEQYGFSSVSELVAGMQKRDNNRLLRSVIDALTINETSFFRDSRPFETLRNYVVPALVKSNHSARSFRVWCAAASTGQESYSVAMSLAEEKAQIAGWTYSIVGTDISPTALKRAVEAKYSTFEVSRGLPEALRTRYFDCTDGTWTAKSSIRGATSFSEHNLVSDAGRLGNFDVVFCRNVLIYFDLPTKKLVLDHIHRRLRPGGYLFLGAAETIIGVSDRFRIIPGRAGLYERIDCSETDRTNPKAIKLVA